MREQGTLPSDLLLAPSGSFAFGCVYRTISTEHGPLVSTWADVLPMSSRRRPAAAAAHDHEIERFLVQLLEQLVGRPAFGHDRLALCETRRQRLSEIASVRRAPPARFARVPSATLRPSPPRPDRALSSAASRAARSSASAGPRSSRCRPRPQAMRLDLQRGRFARRIPATIVRGQH